MPKFKVYKRIDGYAVKEVEAPTARVAVEMTRDEDVVDTMPGWQFTMLEVWGEGEPEEVL
jgi:hypothetical protein